MANLVTINDRLGVTFTKGLLLSQVFPRTIKYPRISINFKLSQFYGQFRFLEVPNMRIIMQFHVHWNSYYVAHFLVL